MDVERNISEKKRSATKNDPSRETAGATAAGAGEARALVKVRRQQGPLIEFVRNVNTIGDDAIHFMERKQPSIEATRAFAERVASFPTWDEFDRLRTLAKEAAYGKCGERSAAILIGLFADALVPADVNQVIAVANIVDPLTHGDENDDDRREGFRGFSEPVIFRGAEQIRRRNKFSPAPFEWRVACVDARNEFVSASQAQYPFGTEHWIERGKRIAALLPKDDPLALAVMKKVEDDDWF